MENASGKSVVWLIKDPAQSVSLAGPIKKIISARRLTLFSSWKEALQSVKHSPPQLIFIEGSPSASEIEQIRSRLPGVPLFSVTSYDDVYSLRSSRVSRPSSQLLPQRAHEVKDEYAFTDRESEILLLMLKGFIKKEIAEHLSLSFHTVNNHERRIYRKLKVHTRSAAVAKALMEGLW